MPRTSIYSTVNATYKYICKCHVQVYTLYSTVNDKYNYILYCKWHVQVYTLYSTVNDTYKYILYCKCLVQVYTVHFPYQFYHQPCTVYKKKLGLKLFKLPEFRGRLEYKYFVVSVYRPHLREKCIKKSSISYQGDSILTFILFYSAQRKKILNFSMRFNLNYLHLI